MLPASPHEIPAKTPGFADRTGPKRFKIKSKKCSPPPQLPPSMSAVARARRVAPQSAGAWDDCIAACRSAFATRSAPPFRPGDPGDRAPANRRNRRRHRRRAPSFGTLAARPDSPLALCDAAPNGRTATAMAAREFERILTLMYPDAPWTADARDAIESLDRLQTSHILMMAAEHDEFRWKLERDLNGLLEENNFHLSENGYRVAAPDDSQFGSRSRNPRAQSALTRLQQTTKSPPKSGDFCGLFDF